MISPAYCWCSSTQCSAQHQQRHKLLGLKDQLGSIEAGKLADIVAVDGDPLKDPKSFGKVVFVMKDGVVYKQ